MIVVLIKSYTDKPWRSPGTYQLIEKGLKENWQVESISTREVDVLRGFIESIRRDSDVFVFNIAEYLDEKEKTGFLPALLEEWQVAHLGSSAQANAIGLDKARTKERLLENPIPTPKYFVVHAEREQITNRADAIGYPLIVKPLGEGGHIGIEEDSIVHDGASLLTAVKKVIVSYHQPALVEEYINDSGMREFSVGIIDGEKRHFTTMEIDYEAMNLEIPILTFEAAQKDLERIKPVHEETIRKEVIDLAERTFMAIGAQDYSRIDMRMNQEGCFVLEINVMPGLGPESFLPQSVKEQLDLDYRHLVQTLAVESMKRQNL